MWELKRLLPIFVIYGYENDRGNINNLWFCLDIIRYIIRCLCLSPGESMLGISAAAHVCPLLVSAHTWATKQAAGVKTGRFKADKPDAEIMWGRFDLILSSNIPRSSFQHCIICGPLFLQSCTLWVSSVGFSTADSSHCFFFALAGRLPVCLHYPPPPWAHRERWGWQIIHSANISRVPLPVAQLFKRETRRWEHKK